MKAPLRYRVIWLVDMDCRLRAAVQDLRLMGTIDKYRMVRRPGAMPFCIPRKEWDALPEAPPTGDQIAAMVPPGTKRAKVRR